MDQRKVPVPGELVVLVEDGVRPNTNDLQNLANI